jgi:hypothetical protein
MRPSCDAYRASTLGLHMDYLRITCGLPTDYPRIIRGLLADYPKKKMIKMGCDTLFYMFLGTGNRLMAKWA